MSRSRAIGNVVLVIDFVLREDTYYRMGVELWVWSDECTPNHRLRQPGEKEISSEQRRAFSCNMSTIHIDYSFSIHIALRALNLRIVHVAM